MEASTPKIERDFSQLTDAQLNEIKDDITPIKHALIEEKYQRDCGQPPTLEISDSDLRSILDEISDFKREIIYEIYDRTIAAQRRERKTLGIAQHPK